MILEYFNNDTTITNKELKAELIDSRVMDNLDSICMYLHHIKYLRPTIREYKNISIGTYIDYPLGISSEYTRMQMLEESIGLGIDFINVTMQTHWITNRKYDKIRQEITQFSDICKKHDIEIRYNLEYRHFDHILLKKICGLLMMNNIRKVYPSTCFFLDDINDNLIACRFLSKETGIYSICTGNAWTQQHMQNIIKARIYGFSSNSIFSLIKFMDTDIAEESDET